MKILKKSQLIEKNIDLSDDRYFWQVAETLSQAQYRKLLALDYRKQYQAIVEMLVGLGFRPQRIMARSGEFI